MLLFFKLGSKLQDQVLVVLVRLRDLVQLSILLVHGLLQSLVEVDLQIGLKIRDRRYAEEIEQNFTGKKTAKAKLV